MSLSAKYSVEPRCAYCGRGRLSADGENVLCKKYGVVDKDYSCKKFVYDALKRVPKRPKPLEKFDSEDFKL